MGQTIKCTCDPLPYLLAALCTKMQDNKTGNTIVYLTMRPYILSTTTIPPFCMCYVMFLIYIQYSVSHCLYYYCYV